jgi:methionyl-tRNA formyltransferase
LQAICEGTLELKPQDHGRATFTRKLSKEDGALDFSLSAVEIGNRIRALTPHIGCCIDYHGTPLKIGAVSVDRADCSAFECGEIISVSGDALKIATGNGSLMIHRLQRPGGRMLEILDFANGFGIRSGEIIPSYAPQPLLSTSPFLRKRK